MLTKAEIIANIAEKAELSKKDAEKAVNAFVELVNAEVVAGNEFRVTGLGTFRQIDRAARKGRNPQTGEEIEIPASKAVSFKAAAPFKRAVSGK